MKSFTLLTLAATARLAASHATVFAIWVNGEDKGLGNTADGYIRSPPNNNPITDVTSSSMACNVNNVAVPKTIAVAAGDTVTVEWHHNNRDASDDIIASSHKGPVMTYLAPTESNGAGDVWVKIQEEGFTGGKWAVDNLIANKGKYDITVPSVAPGNYLLRSEIIALHEGNRQAGAQFYMECVQLEVTGSGTTTLPAGVSIPGAYSATDPGILMDIYNSFTSYTIPGPAVWDGASSGGGGGAPTSAAAPVPAPTATEAATPTTAVSGGQPTSAASGTATSAAAPAPTSAAAEEEYTSVPVAESTSAAAASSIAGAIPTSFVTVTVTATVASAACAATPTAEAVDTVSAAAWQQCGGINFAGATACAAGLTCKVQNEYYSQCVSA